MTTERSSECNTDNEEVYILVPCLTAKEIRAIIQEFEKEGEDEQETEQL